MNCVLESFRGVASEEEEIVRPTPPSLTIGQPRPRVTAGGSDLAAVARRLVH